MCPDILHLLLSIDENLSRIADAVCDGAPAAVDPHAAYARAEAARLLGVSVWLVDKARKSGMLIEAERLGQRDVRITGESLARYHKERQGRTCVKVNRL